MGKAVLLSGALHVAVILVLVVGLPSFVSTPEVAPPIPVELVELDEVPSKPAPKPKPKPEPEKQPEPEPEPQQAEIPPAPKPVPLAPEPEPEPETVELPPELAPEPPEPEAEPEEKKQEELAEAPPKPQHKPTLKVPVPDQPQEPAEPQDRLTSILRNVEKLREQQAAKPAEDPEPDAAPESRASRFELMELVRAIQQQMSSCWRIEPGARDAEDLIVEIHVLLNRDGSVRVANIVDNSRMATDAFYRSAAENARRAILSCQPFQLPPKRYEVWRDMKLTFNPSEMFGG